MILAISAFAALVSMGNAAIGAAAWAGSLVAPHQVHGDHVVRVTSAEPEELLARRREAREGADAVVCTVPHVPALLCFADCVPVVVCAPGGFAVAHSGWRGTIARIGAKAARALMDETRRTTRSLPSSWSAS